MSSSEEVSCPWNMGKRGGVKGDRLGDLGGEEIKGAAWPGKAGFRGILKSK
jgi:hypothetical protein